MYCLISQPEDMLKLCLNLSKSWAIYADKGYAYIKDYMLLCDNNLKRILLIRKGLI